jgi:hypothetical protein
MKFGMSSNGQKQETENRKGGKTFSGEPPYPPINIKVHPSHHQLARTAASAGFASPKDIGSLNIPGFKDVAVKEYGEWLASNVSDNSLKAAFRQACDITLQ